MVKFYKVTTGIENEVVKSINFHRFNNGEVAMIEENVVRVEADEALIVEWIGMQNCDPVALTVEEEAIVIKAYEKINGAAYGLYKIPFTDMDAMGMLQVKAAFELGLTATNIEFSNGTVMPMSAAEFPVFALWFVEKRNGYFV